MVAVVDIQRCVYTSHPLFREVVFFFSDNLCYPMRFSSVVLICTACYDIIVSLAVFVCVCVFFVYFLL